MTGNDTDGSGRKKRNQITVACNECRRRKTKCDGLRPSCQTCKRRDSQCAYDADPDATPIMALKRKHEQLQQQAYDNDELIEMLMSKPESEATAILRRMRQYGRDSSAGASSSRRRPPAEAVKHDLPPLSSALSNTTSLPSFRTLTEQLDQHTTSGSQYTTSPPPPPTHSGPAPLLPPFDQTSFATHRRTSPASASQWRNVDRGSYSSSGRLPLTELQPLLLKHHSSSYSDATTTSSSSAYDRLSPFASSSSPPAMHPPPAPPSQRTSARPIDPRLAGVDPASWGVNYMDLSTFSDLLNSYFCWDHPQWRLFDEDLFYEGLRTGRGEFCSEFLVHSVIAFAATNYAAIEPTVAAAAGHRAIAEARKLWEIEQGNDSLPSIPAGLLLQATYTGNGKDKAGHIYLMQAVRTAQDLGLFRQTQPVDLGRHQETKVLHARNVIAWALFAQQAAIRLNMREDPYLLRPPSVSLPDMNHAGDDKTWGPYPYAEPACSGMSDSGFRALATLWTIAHDTLPVRDASQGVDMSVEALEKVQTTYSRLLQWLDELPHGLTHHDYGPPCVLVLRMHYHQILLELLRPFADAGEGIDATPQQQRLPSSYSWLADQANAVMASSSQQLRDSLYLYDRQHHGSPIPLGMTGGLIHVAFDTIQILRPVLSPSVSRRPSMATSTAHAPIAPSPSSSSATSTGSPNGRKDQTPASTPSSFLDARYFFSLCVRLLRRMSDNFPIAQYILEAILVAVTRYAIVMPADAQTVFDNLRRNKPWKSGSGVVKSKWPVDLSLISSDFEASKLENLIGQTGGMTI